MGDEETVTIIQVQARLAAEELEALDVFPDEPDECSWLSESKSQAIYACATCTPEGNAGICYSCSIRCHADHELYELWDKRDFKCDCGNDKFDPSFQCGLMPKKGVTNAGNRYNHNFSGRYCVCDQKYDPVSDTVMFKCQLCEDWFHSQCLPGLLPVAAFRDLICAGCVGKHSFLGRYGGRLQEPNKEENVTIDESSTEPAAKRARSDACLLSADRTPHDLF